MITIALTNQKGGVGKTTSTINLGYALASRSKRVLMVDADPQASLTFYAGHNERELELQQRTLYYGLVKDKPITELVIPGSPALIPSSITLSKADRELMSMMRYSATLLRDKLRAVAEDYDYVLIDCPPTLTVITSNALTAADLVLIPVKTDLLSIMGIPLLLQEIEAIRVQENPSLRIAGILPTLYNAHFKQDAEALNELKLIAQQHHLMDFMPIPRSTSFDQAVAEGLPTIALSPHAPSVDSYYALADKLIAYEH